MATLNRFIAFGAGSAIVLAATAQVALPPCCKYLWEWPSEDNPPEGGCTGWYTTSCQTGSKNVWGEDPMSREKGNLVQAQCLSVVLGPGADFVRQDCSDAPPAGGHFIGVLPNGQCCYATGYLPDIDIQYEDAGYLIKQCDRACTEFEA